MNSSDFVELSFPVPWGHIAAKAWGDPCGKPVLCIHGRQDNAGTFDRLVQELPSVFYYVCLDLPGHGYSTRLPKGIPLDMMMFVNAIRRVQLQLKWEQFYFLGHSLGGQLGTIYAAMYPEYVLKLISLDSWSPLTVPQENYTKYNRKLIEKTIDLEQRLQGKSPPTYTYEEALKRLIVNRPTEITNEAAKTLLPRILKSNREGYYYSTDQRMKFPLLSPIDTQLYLYNMSKISCPFLCILTQLTMKYQEEEFYGTSDKQALQVYKKNPGFKLIIVDGQHDVHNNEPSKVASVISEFLLHEKCLL